MLLQAARRADVFQESSPLRTLSYAHILIDAPHGLTILSLSCLSSGLILYIKGLVGKEQAPLLELIYLLCVGLASALGQMMYDKEKGSKRSCLERTICGHRGRNSRMTPRQLHAVLQLQV
uniref:Uncharacterized protein n=1 Tax=Ulva partita TaxID=1605170 RepID=A0A1C9ZPS5_9CHLO|nr:hypothetical protein [Ulva partita]